MVFRFRPPQIVVGSPCLQVKYILNSSAQFSPKIPLLSHLFTQRTVHTVVAATSYGSFVPCNSLRTPGNQFPIYLLTVALSLFPFVHSCLPSSSILFILLFFHFVPSTTCSFKYPVSYPPQHLLYSIFLFLHPTSSFVPLCATCFGHNSLLLSFYYYIYFHISFPCSLSLLL